MLKYKFFRIDIEFKLQRQAEVTFSKMDANLMLINVRG